MIQPKNQTVIIRNPEKIIEQPHKLKSLFALTIYFNYNHHETGRQVIKTLYSRDTQKERREWEASLTKFKANYQSFYGYSALKHWVETKLLPFGKLWYAVLADNHPLGIDPITNLPWAYEAWEKLPGTRKNFIENGAADTETYRKLDPNKLKPFDLRPDPHTDQAAYLEWYDRQIRNAQRSYK